MTDYSLDATIDVASWSSMIWWVSWKTDSSIADALNANLRLRPGDYATFIITTPCLW